MGVGTGVAKGALKLWLNDHEVAAETSLSILDILKKKATGLFAQESGEAVFKRIARDVAREIEPLFKASGLNAGSQSSVADFVAKTINGAGAA